MVMLAKRRLKGSCPVTIRSCAWEKTHVGRQNLGLLRNSTTIWTNLDDARKRKMESVLTHGILTLAPLHGKTLRS